MVLFISFFKPVWIAVFKKFYYTLFQPITLHKENDDPHLKLPPPHKQFLISPPASPPVDWEQSHEASPRINYDLLSAVAELAPGMYIYITHYKH